MTYQVAQEGNQAAREGNQEAQDGKQAAQEDNQTAHPKMLSMKDKVAGTNVARNKESVISVDQKASVVAMGGKIKVVAAMDPLEFQAKDMSVLRDQLQLQFQHHLQQMLSMKDNPAGTNVTTNKESVITVDQEVSVVAMGGTIKAVAAMVPLEFQAMDMSVLKDQRRMEPMIAQFQESI